MAQSKMKSLQPQSVLSHLRQSSSLIMGDGRSGQGGSHGVLGDLQGRNQDEQWYSPVEVWPQHQFQSEVILVLGPRREGKGLYMQYQAAVMKARYQRWHKRFKIFANYKNTLADVQAADLVPALTQFPGWAQNGLVLIDEVVTALPSARAVSDINMGFSDFLTQIGKRNIEVVAATQYARMLDVKVLLQVNWIVNIRKIKEGRGLRVRAYDLWGNILPGLEMRRPEIPPWWKYDQSFVIWGTDALFPTYNTHEIIPPLRMEKKDLAQYADILRSQGHEYATPDEDEPD